MANPRKPRALKAVAGTDRPDRDRPELELPPADGIPEPPDFLDIRGSQEFTRVANLLHGAGVLAAVDNAILAAYAGAWAGLVRRWSSGVHPTAADLNAFRALAGELGLSPAARARIPGDSGKKNPKNPFANNGKRPGG